MSNPILPTPTPGQVRLEREWIGYVTTVFPGGVGAVQLSEMRTTFIAGALVALQIAEQISHLPEEQALRALAKFRQEVLALARERIDQAKARN